MRPPALTFAQPPAAPRRLESPARRACLQAGALAALAWCAPALAQQPSVLRTLRFGLPPMGGVLESRRNWEPLLADLAQTLGRPVAAVSMSSYESLEHAIAQRQLDLAFLSGKLALDAVTLHGMRVVAEVQRQPGRPAHRAILLVRKAPPLNTLAALLAEPERWRIARGDRRSVSGYILPQAMLFAPRGIEIETRFASEFIGTHQETALAVANGDADVATNNTTDFARFRSQFPIEAERLQVIWESADSPPAQIVLRAGLPAEFQMRVQDFLVTYGRVPGAMGDTQRSVLQVLQATLGFRRADNSALLPVAQLERDLAHQRALTGQWVSEAARQARLARLDAEHAQQVSVLQRDVLLWK